MATRACITLNYKCGRPGGWEVSGENADGKIPEYQSIHAYMGSSMKNALIHTLATVC